MVLEAAAISIVDRLIQLLNIRERNREKYFKNFIEPLYKDAEPIAKDYMGLLTELAHRVQKARSIHDVIPWLEERRTAYQAVRMKLRAALPDDVMKIEQIVKTESVAPKKFTAIDRFRSGLLGLMTGGCSLTDGSLDGGNSGMDKYGYRGHTILTLLEYMQSKDETKITPRRRGELMAQVKGQQGALENAWAEVVQGYAELKAKHL
jgi:hypothetical protein